MASSKTISWQAEVQNADPQWLQKKLRPIRYEFSNGKRFVARPDEYVAPGP